MALRIYLLKTTVDGQKLKVMQDFVHQPYGSSVALEV